MINPSRLRADWARPRFLHQRRGENGRWGTPPPSDHVLACHLGDIKGITALHPPVSVSLELPGCDKSTATSVPRPRSADRLFGAERRRRFGTRALEQFEDPTVQQNTSRRAVTARVFKTSWRERSGFEAVQGWFA